MGTNGHRIPASRAASILATAGAFAAMTAIFDAAAAQPYHRGQAPTSNHAMAMASMPRQTTAAMPVQRGAAALPAPRVIEAPAAARRLQFGRAGMRQGGRDAAGLAAGLAIGLAGAAYGYGYGRPDVDEAYGYAPGYQPAYAYSPNDGYGPAYHYVSPATGGFDYADLPTVRLPDGPSYGNGPVPDGVIHLAGREFECGLPRFPHGVCIEHGGPDTGRAFWAE